MRETSLDEWVDRGKGRKRRPKGKSIHRRPTDPQALQDSIRWIRMRSEYLEREGILVRTGKRSYYLNTSEKKK